MTNATRTTHGLLLAASLLIAVPAADAASSRRSATGAPAPSGAAAASPAAVSAPAARAAVPVGACAFPTGDRRRIVWTTDDAGLIYNKGRGIEQMMLDGSATTTLVEVPGPGALDFDVSPDGSVLAYTQPGQIAADCSGIDPELRTMRIVGQAPLRRIKEPRGHFTAVRFSPDGQHVAANLKDFGAAPKSQVMIYDSSFNFVGSFDDWGGILWRGDGRRLGIFSWNAISIWDARDWTQLKSIRRPEGRIGQVAWSPDGAFLAAWTESEKGCETDPSGSQLVIFDAATWTVTKTIPEPGRCALDLAWNPKVGAPVLAGFLRETPAKGPPKNGRPSYRIAVWNTHTWEEVGGSPTGQDRAAALVWSHSGERIAVGFDELLVFELGDLGSPPGASNEPRSLIGEEPQATPTPADSTPPVQAPVQPTAPASSPIPSSAQPSAPPPAMPPMVPAPPPPLHSTYPKSQKP